MSRGSAADNLRPVAAPKRVLIDWDWGAHGIWTIPSGEDLAPPVRALLVRDLPRNGEPRPRPWSDKLPEKLLDALQAWNDIGERLFHYGEPDRDAADQQKQEAEFRRRAEQLAAWTQRELGPEYEVLFVAAGGAWQWVEQPASRSGRRT